MGIVPWDHIVRCLSKSELKTLQNAKFKELKRTDRRRIISVELGREIYRNYCKCKTCLNTECDEMKTDECMMCERSIRKCLLIGGMAEEDILSFCKTMINKGEKTLNCFLNTDGSCRVLKLKCNLYMNEEMVAERRKKLEEEADRIERLNRLPSVKYIGDLPGVLGSSYWKPRERGNKNR